MKNRLIYIGFMLVLVWGIAACSEAPPPQPPPQNRAASAAIPAVTTPEAVAEEEKAPEYVYNPLGKRDPFENPLRALGDIVSDAGVPLTPLQKFDLGQLRLIGVIIGKGEPRAMVVAPDGKSFILSVGTKVGKNNGSVMKITTESVQVKEKYFDFAGEVKTSVQEIKLPKQGGAK